MDAQSCLVAWLNLGLLVGFMTWVVPGTCGSSINESCRSGSDSFRISMLNTTEISNKSSLNKIIVYYLLLESLEIGTPGLIW